MQVYEAPLRDMRFVLRELHGDDGFAVPLEQLGKDDRTAFEFQRTISRLDEMQSEEYLAKGLRDAAVEGASPLSP